MRAALARLRLRLPLPASGTPARRAFDRPMAIACLVERAPCLPWRMSSSSSRTTSPATVLADLPARAFRRARSSVRFSGMGFPSVKFAQLVFRRVEHLALPARHSAPGPVDVKVQHRHRRAKRRALAAVATLGRALERARPRPPAPPGGKAPLQNQRGAPRPDPARPPLA